VRVDEAAAPHRPPDIAVNVGPTSASLFIVYIRHIDRRITVIHSHQGSNTLLRNTPPPLLSVPKRTGEALTRLGLFLSQESVLG